MTPAAAQEAAQDDAPPPGFLVGEYELVGRAPGFEGAALLDWVRIVPAPDGTLLLDACRLGLGTLRADWRVEAPLMPLIGRLGEWELSCDMFVDRGNYPQLICYATEPGEQAEIPGLISLWWTEWDNPGHAAECP